MISDTDIQSATDPNAIATGADPSPEQRAGFSNVVSGIAHPNAPSWYGNAPAAPMSVADSATNARMPGAGNNMHDADASIPSPGNATGTAPTSYKAPGPITAAAGMTTEQANAQYGPINAGLNAQAAQDQQQGRETGLAQNNASRASWEATQAENALRVANNSSSRTGFRPVRDAQANLNTSRAARDAADSKLATAVGGRNYIQEAQARQTMTQGAQGGQQELAKGAQALQAGQYNLQQQQRQQQAVDALHNAKTPEEQKSATSNLLVMQGKNPGEWDVKTIGGRVVVGPDGSSTVVGGYGVMVNKLTGEHQLVGPPPQSELNDRGAQHPDGTPGTVDGVKGTIQGGKFVPNK